MARFSLICLLAAVACTEGFVMTATPPKSAVSRQRLLRDAALAGSAAIATGVGAAFAADKVRAPAEDLPLPESRGLSPNPKMKVFEPVTPGTTTGTPLEAPQIPGKEQKPDLSKPKNPAPGLKMPSAPSPPSPGEAAKGLKNKFDKSTPDLPGNPGQAAKGLFKNPFGGGGGGNVPVPDPKDAAKGLKGQAEQKGRELKGAIDSKKF